MVGDPDMLKMRFQLQEAIDGSAPAEVRASGVLGSDEVPQNLPIEIQDFVFISGTPEP